MDQTVVSQSGDSGAAAVLLAARGGGGLDLTGMRTRRTSERIIGALLFACGALSILTTLGVVFVLFEQAIEFFADVPVWGFLSGTRWTAPRDNAVYGVLPLVAGTLMITLIAVLVALPLGLMSAIYLSEYAPPRTRSLVKPALELLAGVPTIVYGYFALTFITPVLIKRIFPGAEVFNVLSAGVAVGIMIVPMVASLSEDAMRSVPRALREGSYALGATKLEVSLGVIVPAALSGIFASFILAISRAVGETMIVALAAGSRPQLTSNPLEPMQAMTGYIVQVFSGDVVAGTTAFKSLFAVGLLLFLITLLMNILSQWIVARYREVYE